MHLICTSVSINEEKDTVSCVMRNLLFAYAKTNAQFKCTVTAQLISAFVFAT